MFAVQVSGREVDNPRFGVTTFFVFAAFFQSLDVSIACQLINQDATCTVEALPDFQTAVGSCPALDKIQAHVSFQEIPKASFSSFLLVTCQQIQLVFNYSR